MTMVRCRPLTDLFNFGGDPNRPWTTCYDGMPGQDTSAMKRSLDADVKETSTSYVVSVELPGTQQQDISVTVQENVLTLKGEKKREKIDDQTAFCVRERCFGSFERSFTLPTNVQTDKVTASYKKGILSITLPKVEEAKPRNVEVKAA